MRRQDIKLIALARQGDIAACCEAGRRYLCGEDGFPRHVASGVDYLNRQNVRNSPEAARILAEYLPLQEIVLRNQEWALDRAAAAGVAVAQFKRGVWECIGLNRPEGGRRWLAMASQAGHEAARRALAAFRRPVGPRTTIMLAQVLREVDQVDVLQLAVIALRIAVDQRRLDRLENCLRTTLELSQPVSPELAELVSTAVGIAETSGSSLNDVTPLGIQLCLETRASGGDGDAAYLLGRALCGIPCGAMAPSALCRRQNVRKGVALLMRAADLGKDEAWMHLYRVFGDRRVSAANPQMSRFCLEKAAVSGQTEAQRRLGALVLRESTSLIEMERAIQWLHLAAAARDPHARRLLESLVLPTVARADEAAGAIELLRKEDPLLATRLELARHFGLTKPEALCVDPATGIRPWGLVVARNPFLSQVRRSGARAIPAVSDGAMNVLRQAASLFRDLGRSETPYEGDLRRRSARQRRVFRRHGLEEGVFFVDAPSAVLESLRIGTKWAHRAKESLRQALETSIA